MASTIGGADAASTIGGADAASTIGGASSGWTGGVPVGACGTDTGGSIRSRGGGSCG